MDIIYLFTQITGILGIGVFMTCFHFKNMKNVLSVKLATDVIWATHYLLLAAYAGFFTNVICIFRELIFMNNDKNIFKSKIWLAVFVIANITAGMVAETLAFVSVLIALIKNKSSKSTAC